MTTTALTYHTPVLLQESVNGLNIHQDGIYVDVTFGGGGHSREILSRLGNNGHLYSFDQDADSEKNIVADDRFTFVRSNFRYIRNWMRYYHVEHIDGILADLGVSSHHFDDETRGFSFRFDAPLDMRMNKRAGGTAASVLNSYTEEQLAQIFYLYGELKNARKIEVNQEMGALKEMLTSATELLREGGRLSVITYHSLEDRMVKNIMKTGNPEGKVEKDFFGRSCSPFQLVNSKVIVPSSEEQQTNPRSRSAKLRIAEKVKQ